MSATTMRWPPSEDTALKLILVLSLAGVILSAYLTYLHHLVVELGGACPTRNIPGFDCGDVLVSEQAYLLGIPVAWLGVAGFAGLLGVSLDRFLYMDRARTRYHRLLIPGLALSGLALGIWLTLAEAFIIKQFCPFCLTAFGLGIIITLLALAVYRDYLKWFVNVKLFKRRVATNPEKLFEAETSSHRTGEL